MPLESPRTDFRDLVERGFRSAAFLTELGVTLTDCGHGWCESALRIEPRHLQHTGVIHAGVQSTIADHTAGGAAITMTPIDHVVLTAEFKIHLLRPGIAESLVCHAQVLKPGKAFHVVESEVFALNGSSRTLISKLTATIAVVPAQRQ